MPASLLGLFDLVGFVVLILSGATAVITQVAGRSRPQPYPVLSGFSLTIFAAMVLVMAERLVGDTLSPAVRGVIEQLAASGAWLAAAHTINNALKRWVWYGRLKHGKGSAVPGILIGWATLGIYALAVLLIFSAVFHRDITAIAATSGVVAIVLGYSAQPTLSEIFSGLALNLSRPFKPGDSIQVDGVWGNVVEASWRSVTIRNYEGNLIIIPNSKIAGMRLLNMDLPDNNTRHHIPFIMDIDVPPSRVREVGMAAMLSVPTVLRTPSPMVLFKNIVDEGMAYEAIFWHNNPNVYILRRDEVGGALWTAFRRAGLPFAVKRQQLAQPTERYATPPVKPADPEVDRGRLVTAISRSPFFSYFSPEAILELAAQSQLLVYGEPERIVRQGQPGSSMFVILEGRAGVILEAADGSEQTVATLTPGQSFGHMSLMTGEPRSATVRALSHMVIAEIAKSALSPLLERYPDAIAAIATEITSMQARNEALRTAATVSDAPAEEPGTLINRLASRIQSFFSTKS